MKLLAALVALSLATPAVFAQELEEAPGAAPMNTAPPPSSEDLNDAVDQLSREKTPSTPRGGTRAAAPTKASLPKTGKGSAPATKKPAKKPAKAG